MKHVCGLLLAMLAAPAALAAQAAAAAGDCRVGAYRFDDATTIDIGVATQGLRWRLPDGRYGLLAADGTSTLGSTGRPDGHRLGFAPCPTPTLQFDDRVAQRIDLAIAETTFTSGDALLAGRLVLPRGAGPVTVVVLVHGSERRSALSFDAWQRELPAAGVGVFVYDKRGTGRSTGIYTQDFHQLAADAAAAAVEARRLAGQRGASFAYAGASQGGWVVPLAQSRHAVDRLIVSYGLTVSPLDEDRSEVRMQLAARGYDASALRQADEVTAATGALMASGFREGFDRYADVRRRYGKAAWYRHIEGEFSGEILRYPPWMLRAAAPLARRRDTGTPWRHEPLPPLRAANVPSLWILASEDREAPPAQTRRDLADLQAQGLPLTLLEFPGTDHGIVEFETAADGTRVTTRVAEGYLAAVIDFAADGRLDATRHGNAVLTAPAAR